MKRLRGQPSVFMKNQAVVKTKILFVSSYYVPYSSGITEYLRRLAEGLSSMGHSITVLTSRHDKKLALRETINGVKIMRLPVLFKLSKGAFTPTLLPTLRRISQEYDIINLHAPMPEVGLCALASKNKNIVLTYHCDLGLHHGLHERLIEKAYYRSLNLALPLVRKIIVNDMEYADSSRIKKFRGKVVEINPPIAKFVRKNPAGFKKKYGIKKGELVIGFIGRLVYEKGLEYLVQAVPLVLERIPNARFLIAGEGDRVAGGRKHSVKQRLIDMSKKNKDTVSFLGFIPESLMEEFYSSCDVLVLPSIAPLESFGMVQVEAMQCGTPVIATDMPGVRTPVKKTGMGLIIHPKDSNALAKAIDTVLKKKNKFLKPASEINKRFSIEKTLVKYEQEFKQLL